MYAEWIPPEEITKDQLRALLTCDEGRLPTDVMDAEKLSTALLIREFLLFRLDTTLFCVRVYEKGNFRELAIQGFVDESGKAGWLFPAAVRELKRIGKVLGCSVVTTDTRDKRVAQAMQRVGVKVASYNMILDVETDDE